MTADVPLDELRRALPARAAAVLDRLLEHDDVDFLPEGMRLEATTVREAGVLVVRGDLHVDGALVAWDGCGLVVTGSLRCRQLAACGALLVGGDVLAPGGLVYLNSLNDARAVVGARLDARLLVEEGTVTDLGSTTARVCSLHNVVRVAGVAVERVERDALADAGLVPGVLLEDLRGALVDAMASGAQLFVVDAKHGTVTT